MLNTGIHFDSCELACRKTRQKDTSRTMYITCLHSAIRTVEDIKSRTQIHASLTVIEVERLEFTTN